MTSADRLLAAIEARLAEIESGRLTYGRRGTPTQAMLRRATERDRDTVQRHTPYNGWCKPEGIPVKWPCDEVAPLIPEYLPAPLDEGTR